ncbi:MAG: N-carbamoylputrescine amidase, partial [Deltaproteobacteria bacterium]
GPYFCKTQNAKHFARAQAAAGHQTLGTMQKLAKDLQVVLPVSFFESDGPHHYNSMAMIDATGDILGVYRKSHIPDGCGYQEKFYFRPGNTGFKVWQTRAGRLGVGICWDQWFPEAARAMCLGGAQCLLYPTAIGSEPQAPELDTARLWQRAMLGHAICNLVPIVAANRVGVEDGQAFYGSSFICDEFGDKQAEMSRSDTGVCVHTLDLQRAQAQRAGFGFFRDRRPQLYGALTEP